MHKKTTEQNRINIAASYLSREISSPLIAVLSSAVADESLAKNGVNFADLLAPYCSVDVNVEDPLGNKVQSKVTIDVRDLRRSGFLLSHTVLPHVLYENIASVSEDSDNSQIQPLFKHFASSFLHWFEPTDHDFLRCYLCCMFVVSAHEDHPVEQFEMLEQQQYTQQNSSYNSSTSLSPPYCASPKWMPEVLKYYVLLEDISLGNRNRADQILRCVINKYGSAFCHLLSINSAAFAGLPDVWLEVLEQRYRGLQPGLELARHNLMSNSSSTSKKAMVPVDQRAVLSSISLGSPRSISVLTGQMGNFTLPGLGRCLDESDRQRISTFVASFVQNTLVPFVEWQLKHQYEALAARRRSFGRSVGGLGKWFGAIASTAAKDSLKVYESDSYEYQQRRLADTSFQIGLFDFSLGVYQSLKRNFANDQAWLNHASTLEMAACSSFLSGYFNSELVLEDLRQNYPQRYMDNAINYYLNVSGQPMLALRCGILSVGNLVQLEMMTEATEQLVRLSSSEDLPALFSSLLLEYASFLSHQSNRKRKMAFYSMLAGHRFAQAELRKSSFNSLQKSLSVLVGKGWEHAENHILLALSSHNESLLFGKGRV